MPSGSGTICSANLSGRTCQRRSRRSPLRLRTNPDRKRPPNRLSRARPKARRRPSRRREGCLAAQLRQLRLRRLFSSVGLRSLRQSGKRNKSACRVRYRQADGEGRRRCVIRDSRTGSRTTAIAAAAAVREGNVHALMGERYAVRRICRSADIMQRGTACIGCRFRTAPLTARCSLAVPGVAPDVAGAERYGRTKASGRNAGRV